MKIVRFAALILAALALVPAWAAPTLSQDPEPPKFGLTVLIDIPKWEPVPVLHAKVSDVRNIRLFGLKLGDGEAWALTGWNPATQSTALGGAGVLRTRVADNVWGYAGLAFRYEFDVGEWKSGIVFGFSLDPGG